MTVVSYSDGEGADAGIGVALWHPSYSRPLAGRTEVPDSVRQTWKQARTCRRSQGSDCEYHGIFEIEVIGPLIILHNFGHHMRNSLWIHFIDNAAGLSSLVRGSSSVMNGDVIVGQTWSLVHRLEIVPWFDRVESKSNPVDGLSRGVLSGPWASLVPLAMPDLAPTR